MTTPTPIAPTPRTDDLRDLIRPYIKGQAPRYVAHMLREFEKVEQELNLANEQREELLAALRRMTNYVDAVNNNISLPFFAKKDAEDAFTLIAKCEKSHG